MPHVLRCQGFPGPIDVSEMFGRRFRAHRTATTGDSDEERDGTRRLGPGNARGLLSTGNVAIYAKGASKSCATVSDSTFNFAQIMFATYNNGGDLYIDGLNSGYQTSFGLVTGGCNARSIAYINYVYTVSFPGGIQIDKAGRIAFDDPIRLQVATFDPPVSGTFGNPVSTTPLTGAISPLGFALLASVTDLYVADSGGSGNAEEYPYTAGGSAINTIAAGGQPIGVAVTPPLTKENN